jgi:uncharacterized membrane protein
MEKKNLLKRLVNYFFQGLLFIGPLVVTVYAVKVTFLWIDNLLSDYLLEYFDWDIPGLGFVTILLMITLIGFTGSSILFRPAMHWFDRVISNAPLIKVIYTSVKDMLSAFVGQKKRFTEPVLVKVSGDGALEKIGFITDKDLTQIGIADHKIAVYLPHSYAWSGNLFIVPADRVTKIDAPATEVMKYIISAGITKL